MNFNFHLFGIDTNSRVGQSLCEVNTLVNNSTFLEYSTCFGAVKCFKFLLLQGAMISDNVIDYSVFGGNVKIIDICNQERINFEFIMESSICFHKYNLSNWLHDIHGIKFSLFHSVKFLNLYLFCKSDFEDVNKKIGIKQMTPLIAAAKNGFTDIVRFLSSLTDIDLYRRDNIFLF